MFAVLPADFDPSALYRGAYFGGDQGYGIVDYDGLWDRCLSHFYLPRLGRIECFQKRGRLLEIGCAAGYFLAAAKARGWQVSGVELAPDMRTRAAEALHCTVYESIGQALEGGEGFDCVSMFEVIEHVGDPLGVMGEVVRLLKPGGLLALSTPNCERPCAEKGEPINIWFNPPVHISYFGQGTLRRCMELSGLDVLAVEGLKHYCEAMAGVVALPRWVGAILRPFRRGKRLRPRGLIGRLLKQAYANRLSLYRCKGPGDLSEADVLEVYARRREGPTAPAR